jgi:hypothetical protein
VNTLALYILPKLVLPNSFLLKSILPKSGLAGMCSTKVRFYQSHVCSKMIFDQISFHQSPVLPKSGSTKVQIFENIFYQTPFYQSPFYQSPDLLQFILPGGVESLRMESRINWFFHKTGITQNGKTQNGKTWNGKTQNGKTQNGKT